MAAAKKGNQAFTTWVIYVNIAIYATCFQIQRPLEPYLVEQLKQQQDGGDAASEYAKLQSFFGIVQTVGSLISGRLLDRFGVRGSFMLSFLASAASYAILSQAHSMDMLYYSKIPATFQSAFLCAQAALAQFTTDGPERTKALGMLTMSYTVGSVIGPTIGGILGASGDYYFAAKISAAGSLLSIILTLLAIHDEPQEQPLPQPTTGATDEVPPKKEEEGFVGIIRTILSAVWVLLAAKVISSVANGMFQAIFPLVLKNQFAFSEKALGVTMSVSSFLGAVVNGFFLGKIVDFVGGELHKLIVLCILAMTICAVLHGALASPQALEAFPTYGAAFFLGLTFVSSIFQYMLATTITGASTTLVKDEYKGTLIGLEHSLFAAARIAAPRVGVAVMLALAGPGGVGGYGITAVTWMTAIIYQSVQFVLALNPSAAKKECSSERKEK